MSNFMNDTGEREAMYRVASLETRLSNRNARVAELDASIVYLEKERVEWRDLVGSLRGEIRGLDVKLADANKEIVRSKEETHTRKAHFDRHVESLSDIIRDREAKLVAKDARIAELEEGETAWREGVNRLGAEVRELENKLDIRIAHDTHPHVVLLRIHLGDAKMQLEQANKQVALKSERVAELEKGMRVAHDKLAKDHAAQRQGRIEELETRLTETRQALSEQGVHIEDVIDRLEEWKGKYLAAMKSLKECQCDGYADRVFGLEKKVGELEARLTEARQQTSQHDAHAEDLQDRLGDWTHKCLSAVKEKNRLLEAYKIACSRVLDLEKAQISHEMQPLVISLRIQLDDVKTQFERTDKALQNFKEATSRANERVRDLETKLAQTDEQLASKRTQLEGSSAHVRRLENDLVESRGVANMYMKAYDEKDIDLQNLRIIYTSSRGYDSANLKEQLRTSTSARAYLIIRHETLEKDYAAMSAHFDEARATIERLRRQIERLELPYSCGNMWRPETIRTLFATADVLRAVGPFTRDPSHTGRTMQNARTP